MLIRQKNSHHKLSSYKDKREDIYLTDIYRIRKKDMMEFLLISLEIMKIY